MEARGQSQDEHRVRDPRERPVVPVGRAKIARFYRRGIAPGLWATNDRICTEDRVIVIVSASGIMTVLGNGYLLGSQFLPYHNWGHGTLRPCQSACNERDLRGAMKPSQAFVADRPSG
jgi:hypothetical protein